MRYEAPPLSEELEPFAGLINYINDLSPLAWSYEGDVIARRGNATVPLNGKLSWSGRGGASVLKGPDRAADRLRVVRSGVLPTFQEEDFFTISPIAGMWQARQAYLAGVKHIVNFDEQVAWEELRIGFLSLEIGNGGGNATSHALLLNGVGLRIWPTAFPLYRDRSGDALDGMATEAFNRPAIIRQLPIEKSPEPCVIVAYSGERLTLEEQKSISLTISFITGQLGAIAGTIDFDDDVEIHRVIETNEPNGPPSKPPINWYLPIPRPMMLQLPRMLPSRFRAMNTLLLKEGIPVDVALAHLLSRVRYVDMEIRDITLALDSLIEADAFKQNRTNIAPRKKYNRAVTALLKAFDSVLKDRGFSDAIREGLLPRLDERLRGANDVSHSKRREAFWGRVGFEPGAREKAAIDLRHIVSHRGYLWRGEDGRQRLDGLNEQTRIARTFVNSVFLSLLGYHGYVMDYLTDANLPMQFRR